MTDRFTETDECICHSWDGRGRSVCGFECPAHPLNGKCPCVGCKTIGRRKELNHTSCDVPVHSNQLCVSCAVNLGYEV